MLKCYSALPFLLIGSSALAYAQEQTVEPTEPVEAVVRAEVQPEGGVVLPAEATSHSIVSKLPDDVAIQDSIDSRPFLPPAPPVEEVLFEFDGREWPAYLGSYDAEDEDERGIWQQMDELERKLANQKDILHDQSLTGYLNDVLCNTVGPERCAGTRIYVLRNASFNAGMYPNGMMVVHTGALLRLRTEAELAFLLGHEFAHYEKRHGLQSFKKVRSATDVLTFAQMTGISGTLLSVWMLSDLFSFSRGQEREADLISSEYLDASPYAKRGAADVWVRMLDEDEARAEERDSKSRGRESGWLDSHPAPYVRATYLDRTEDSDFAAGIQRRDLYSVKLAPFIADFFDDQLQRNDFAASEYILEEMAAGEWAADLLQLRGELHRTRGDAEDLKLAIGYHSQAIALGNNNPATWRGLGLAHLRSGNRQAGQQALRVYLGLAPNAPDAAMMKMMSGGT